MTVHSIHIDHQKEKTARKLDTVAPLTFSELDKELDMKREKYKTYKQENSNSEHFILNYLI